MFESGNIQSIPTPELYLKRDLILRTYLDFMSLEAGLDSATLETVVLQSLYNSLPYTPVNSSFIPFDLFTSKVDGFVGESTTLKDVRGGFTAHIKGGHKYRITFSCTELINNVTCYDAAGITGSPTQNLAIDMPSGENVIEFIAVEDHESIGFTVEDFLGTLDICNFKIKDLSEVDQGSVAAALESATLFDTVIQSTFDPATFDDIASLSGALESATLFDVLIGSNYMPPVPPEMATLSGSLESAILTDV